MQEYRIFDPEDFGMYGSPAETEAYAIMEKLDSFGNPTGKAYLAYIGCEDFMDAPMVDLDAIEEIEIDTEGKTPVFEHIYMQRNGGIVLDDADEKDQVSLNERQNDILANPYCVRTRNARYETEDNRGGTIIFDRDLTLDGIQPARLNMRKFIEAVNDKFPALLENTHSRYGYQPPFFPCAKYFEDREKMVVFVAMSQLDDISDDMLTGKVPLYYDYNLGEKWTAENTYGICVIDDRTDKYTVRLVRPETLLDIKREREEKTPHEMER